jgi:hypothetical protein
MKSWPDYDHEDRCPACGDLIEAMTNTSGLGPPDPGSVGVCVYCQAINVIGLDGKLRVPTDGEAMAFALDPELQQLVWAMRQLGPPPRGRR